MSSKGRKSERHVVLYTKGKRISPSQIHNYPNEPIIKFVKIANAWCKTWFEKPQSSVISKKQIDRLQKQQWASTKEELL